MTEKVKNLKVNPNILKVFKVFVKTIFLKSDHKF